jgi:hypothetical protein
MSAQKKTKKPASTKLFSNEDVRDIERFLELREKGEDVYLIMDDLLDPESCQQTLVEPRALNRTAKAFNKLLENLMKRRAANSRELVSKEASTETPAENKSNNDANNCASSSKR